MDEDSKIRILNPLSLTIENEDHTIMNPLKYSIQSDFNKKGVELCGYTIPHPSEPSCNLMVQMKEKNKQTIDNLLDVTSGGIDSLVAIIDRISEKVNAEMD